MKVVSNFGNELATLPIPQSYSNVHVKIISPDGRVIMENKPKNENVSVLKIQRKYPAGKYILSVHTGKTRMTRSFSILP